MNPDDAFERILASLYEAALDDALWPAATTLIEEACGAVGNFLVVGEGSDHKRVDFARLLYRGVDRPDMAREYFTTWFPHDEAPRRRMALVEGQLAHARELYTEGELKTSVAFNEGWRRLGGQDSLTVHFGAPDELRMVWVLGDPAGGDGWQSGQLRLLDRLLPHVHRSVLVRQALAAADALGSPAWRACWTITASAWCSWTAAGACWRRTGRRSTPCAAATGSPTATASCRPGCRRTAAACEACWRARCRTCGGRLPSGGSMTVQRPSGRSRLALHLSPVGDPAADFGGRRVAALALLVDPAGRARIDAQRVAAALGLTPSEARVSALLAEGLRAQEIAAAAGLAESYVRWLFQQVYRKLGVSGQVALVRQVLAADALPRR